MADWTLMKPINDLYALQSRVMKVELTLNEYITSGKKNILSGTDNFDNLFARLEEVHNGKREFIMDGNVPLSEKNTNCSSLEEAKKFWKNTVTDITKNIKSHIDNISKVSDDFSTYPIWLQLNCEFLVQKFYSYLIEYITKDPDISDIDF